MVSSNKDEKGRAGKKKGVVSKAASFLGRERQAAKASFLSSWRVVPFKTFLSM